MQIWEKCLLGVPEREVLIKLERNDSELHESMGRFFSKTTVVLKEVIQSSSN